MLYILAAVLTIIAVWSIIKVSNRKRIIFLNSIMRSQSDIHDFIKDLIPKEMFERPEVMSQSRKHVQKNMIKVVFHKDKAYWTVDNVFYTANSIDGQIDENSVEPLDTSNMSVQEIEIMMKILDNLQGRDGSNDSGSSGH